MLNKSYPMKLIDKRREISTEGSQLKVTALDLSREGKRLLSVKAAPEQPSKAESRPQPVEKRPAALQPA